MRYDWKGITSLAYLTLLEFGVTEFPVAAKIIKLKDVVISSYQKYAELTGLSVEQISLDCEFDDALLLKELRPGLKLILYNKDKYDARLKHTLLHEVGHIKCDHKKHSEQEEVEAHFFAAQANAPNVIIKAITHRGYKVDVRFLMEHFGLSEESAKKKIDYLGKYGFEHTNDYDDTLLMQFSDYINAQFPPMTHHFYDDYFDNLEQERANWR
jgi:hypothetical protein